jgi:hypothetical protein
MLKLNDGCLSVSQNNKYQVKPCNDNDKTQYFNNNMIKDNTEYSKNIEFGNIIKADEVSYPFLMIQSQHNRNCLTSNYTGITVEPCTGTEKQRWSPFSN